MMRKYQIEKMRGVGRKRTGCSMCARGPGREFERGLLEEYNRKGGGLEAVFLPDSMKHQRRERKD